MKIEFEDGSFMELVPSIQNKNKMTFVICGLKDYKQLTMSYSDIEADKVEDIVKFLSNWLEENKSK